MSMVSLLIIAIIFRRILVGPHSKSLIGTPLEARLGKSNYPNSIIFITIDTLRADHLGCYGYPRRTSPFIDDLASKGVLFKNAFSASSHTAPSHASFFTSLYPIQHGVLLNGQTLDKSIDTFAQVLQRVGFETAGFTSVRFLKGLKKGYSYFDIPGSKDSGYRQAKNTVSKAIDWLENKKPDSKYFMWIHLYDPHKPYRSPKYYLETMENLFEENPKPAINYWKDSIGISPENKHNIIVVSEPTYVDRMNKYDSEILYVDNELQRLYTYIKQRGLHQNLLWIITADHGEAFGDRNRYGHGEYIYNEMIRIPLIFFSENKQYKNNIINVLVRSVDMMPTLFDVVNISYKKQYGSIQGFSLLPLLQGKSGMYPAKYSYSERRPKDAKDARGWTKNWEDGNIVCLQDINSKYIYHSINEDEYYDLIDDPREIDNIISIKSDSKNKMRSLLIDKYKIFLRKGENKQSNDIDNEYVKELRALGYL